MCGAVYFWIDKSRTKKKKQLTNIKNKNNVRDYFDANSLVDHRCGDAHMYKSQWNYYAHKATACTELTHFYRAQYDAVLCVCEAMMSLSI